ncbi:ubx domain-containing protein [Curvularia clavata]|uniref:Ubx domain-containing protein n=1 Tax=Curvularia clavata TaxID=95742 RepID=A0A9Q8ZFH1_CURCL|nr:ubx domain-containing protein [Curvularia clavata]
MTNINSLDVLAIKNVLSRYCQALDTKNFDMLNKVFDPDVEANYPFNSSMKSLTEVQEAIKNRLGPIRTHHNLTTQTITFRSDGQTARVMTYFQGVHFGQGPHEGKMLSAYGNQEMELQDMLFATLEDPINCCIVYIRSFTNSGHDFVYCVPALEHLAKFYGGTYGARDYQGPLFAAVVVLAGAVLEKMGPINWKRYTEVPKDKVNGVRWRYLFATARRAWSMMSFTADGLSTLEAVLADVPVQQQSPKPEPRIPDAISISKYPPEAQRIAIRQNVEVLKKKPDHHDRILQYLEAELRGRANRQGKDELTKQQYRLVERLRDNADDFEILYTDEDENGNDIRKADFDKEDEAHLISERDVIIQQILEQLALPITVCDDPGDPDLPELEPSGPPGAPKIDGYSSDEDNLWGEAAEIKKMEAGLVHRLAKFTGAPPNQCEEYLTRANWDIDLALTYFQEDQARSRPGVVRDTNTMGPSERDQAVILFQSLTNADDTVAEYYLEGSGWDMGRAVSRFYEDADSPGDNSKGTDKSIDVVSSKPRAKANEKPEKQILPDSDATTRSAYEPAILSSSLRASIQRRIAELDAKITKIDDQLEGIEGEGLDTIMRNAPKGEKNFTEESGLYTGPRGKLRVVNEDPSPAVTRRKGISHAGLPLELDEVGNVVSYKRPTGTPYQQYLAMRLRLQVQHYGHEVVSSDDDPHRGIPTRERCPAPLIQEEFSDSSSSSSSDDNIIPPGDTHKAARIQRRSDILREMAELLDILAAAQGAEPTESTDEADAADSLPQLQDQPPSDPTEQAGQAVQFVIWQGGAEGEEGEEGEEGDEVDAPFDSEPEYCDEDAPSTKNVDQEKRAPIKSALRDTSQSRKRTIKVRFDLDDEESNLPTGNKRGKEVERKSPRRGRSVRRGTRRSERLRLKAMSRNAKDKTSTGDEPADKPIGEEIEGGIVTQGTQTEGENVKPEAQKEEAKAQKKRDSFVSKENDAWDGSHSDEGELELGFDVDAEGEEEDIEGQQEGGVEEQQTEKVDVQQGKVKGLLRIDEKMEG